MTCISLSLAVAYSALSFTRYPFCLEAWIATFEAVLDSNFTLFLHISFSRIMYIYWYSGSLSCPGL